MTAVADWPASPAPSQRMDRISPLGMPTGARPAAAGSLPMFQTPLAAS